MFNKKDEILVNKILGAVFGENPSNPRLVLKDYSSIELLELSNKIANMNKEDKKVNSSQIKKEELDIVANEIYKDIQVMIESEIITRETFELAIETSKKRSKTLSKNLN